MQNITQSYITKDPKTWDQVYGQQTVVDTCRRMVRSNRFPTALLLSGHSGTGKGTVARQLIRATQCQQRSVGQEEGCGTCPSCLSDPRLGTLGLNRFWVQQGSGSGTIHSQISAAIKAIAQGPQTIQDPHNTRLFVVVDEIQTIPKDKLHEILFFPELESLEQTTLILITMDLGRIQAKDSALCLALQSRCCHLRFSAFTDEQLDAYLIGNYPEISNPESRQLIIQASTGSLRSLLSHIDTIRGARAGWEPQLVADLLFMASPILRSQLWNAIRQANYKEIKAIVQQIQPVIDERLFVRQLEDDLCSSEGSSHDRPLALRILNGHTFYNLDLLRTLRSLAGLDVGL